MQQYMLQIVRHLENKGYKKLNPDSNNVYGRTEGDTVYVVVIGSSHGLTAETLQKFNSKIILDMVQNTGMRVELLNILLTSDGLFDDAIKDIVDKLENVWLFTEDYGKLYVFENQPEDFDGLYHLVDKNTIVEHEKYITRIKRLFGVITPVLVLINVVIYIISSMNMDNDGWSFIISNLADNLDAVVNRHQYYRIITSMFVHFGITHIVSNMIILVALGARIENLIGKVGMLLSYLITGTVASIVSLVSTYISYCLGNITIIDIKYQYSAGASGAIFGLMGIMIMLAIFNKGRISDLSLWNLAVLSVLTIMNGYVSGENIDNAAHIGGLTAGFIIGVIIALTNQKVVKKRTM